MSTAFVAQFPVAQAIESEPYPVSMQGGNDRDPDDERQPDIPDGESGGHERGETVVLVLAEVARSER